MNKPNIVTNGELEDRVNKIYIDLIFALASGEAVQEGFSYEDQLEYYIMSILKNRSYINDFFEFGRNYRRISKLMYPNSPNKVKNKFYLIRFFANFVVIKALYKCQDFKIAENYFEIVNRCLRYNIFTNQEYKNKFVDEVKMVAKRYITQMDSILYYNFIAIIQQYESAFENTYQCIFKCLGGNQNNIDYMAKTLQPNIKQPVDYLETIFKLYNIPTVNHIKFHLELDALIESTCAKNKKIDYMSGFKEEWHDHLPQYSYSQELENYIRNKKNMYIIAYGNNFSKIKNENLLFSIVSDIFIKLAILDGAKNLHDLHKQINTLLSVFSVNIKNVLNEKIEQNIISYKLNHDNAFSDTLRDTLIPYQSYLLYLKAIVTEEICSREGKNIEKQNKHLLKELENNDEYKLIIAKKDEEIHALKQEIEYYENIKMQNFQASLLEYDKALTSLLSKLCDIKFNAPLNELYLLTIENKNIKIDDIKSVIHNLIFILKMFFNISPFATSNVGKYVEFSDSEANEKYSVDEHKLKKGQNQGIQIYPGWMYKKDILVLPRVNIENSNKD